MEIDPNNIERGFLGALFAGLMTAIYGLVHMRDKVNKHEQILQGMPEKISKMADDISFMRGRWEDRRRDD